MKEDKRKRGKRTYILTSIIVAFIIISIIVIVVLTKKQPTQAPEKDITFDYSDSEVDMTNRENAEVKNGLKIAISDKIKEEKIYNDMKVSEAEITATKNRSNFVAKVKNIHDKQIEGEIVDILFFNKNGSEIARVETFFPDLEPNGEAQITATTGKDIANAYDYTIVKK